MKKFLFIAFVFFAVYVLYSPVSLALAQKNVNSLFYYSVCDSPIHYRIDTIDTRFNISRKEFLQDVQKATNVWSLAYGKALFVYDSEGELSLNMVYDQRQYLNNQINQLEGKLDTDKSTIQARLQEYETRAADFKKRLAALNAEISEWNKKGGAPPDVFERLKSEQQSLKNEADQLNILARSVNKSADSYNGQIGDLNQTIQSFNNELHLKPEEGLYMSRENKIDIYFNNGQNELIHTLAHELGHALGLDHNQNPASVMYPFTTQNMRLSQDDFTSLSSLCAKKPIYVKFTSSLISLLRNLQKR